MADTPFPQPYSWAQGLAGMLGGGAGLLGGQTPGGGFGGGLNNFIAALMKGSQSPRPSSPPGIGTYEGNIQSAANPFDPNKASFGMPPTPAAPHPAQPAAPHNPFTSGAAPFQFGNPMMSALFSRPPMSAPPNPTASMNL